MIKMSSEVKPLQLDLNNKIGTLSTSQIDRVLERIREFKNPDIQASEEPALESPTVETSYSVPGEIPGLARDLF
jgi:hypothetical protein